MPKYPMRRANLAALLNDISLDIILGIALVFFIAIAFIISLVTTLDMILGIGIVTATIFLLLLPRLKSSSYVAVRPSTFHQ